MSTLFSFKILYDSHVEMQTSSQRFNTWQEAATALAEFLTISAKNGDFPLAALCVVCEGGKS